MQQVRARRSLLRRYSSMELPASLSTDDPSHAQTIFQVNFAAVIPTPLSLSPSACHAQNLSPLLCVAALCCLCLCFHCLTMCKKIESGSLVVLRW